MLVVPDSIGYAASVHHRVRKALRFILLALVIVGIMPGTHEIAETVGHLIHEGHLPHSAQHDRVAISEQLPSDDEHGCTPIDHHCECHTSQPAVPPRDPMAPMAKIVQVGDRLRIVAERRPPDLTEAPPLPPPIV